MLSKIKIVITRIFILENYHEIDRKQRLNIDKIEKILTSSIFQNLTVARTFFGIIHLMCLNIHY